MHEVRFSVRSREHNRTFDNRHDVASQLSDIHVSRRMMCLDRRLQMRLEFQRHLVEALRQPLAKGGVRIAQCRAEVADDTATLPLAAPGDHLTNGVQTPKDVLERIVTRVAAQTLFDPVQLLATLLHVSVDHREPELFLAFGSDGRTRRWSPRQP